MQVRPISITKSLVPDIESAEDLLVYIARVSNPENQKNMSTAERLLRYLITHKHNSPFDMADLCVEVKTSRAIAQQILRHWSIDFQEFSQRYAEVIDIEPIKIREVGSTTRQGSKEGDFDPWVEFDDGKGSLIEGYASELGDVVINLLKNFYKALIKANVAKESARFYLPLATQTTLYMKGSVRSWMFYLAQRLDAHAQLEHREVAQEIEKIFKQHFPNVHKAFFESEDGSH